MEYFKQTTKGVREFMKIPDGDEATYGITTPQVVCPLQPNIEAACIQKHILLQRAKCPYLDKR